MERADGRSRSERLRAHAWVLASALVPWTLYQLRFGAVELNLADEGFLWEGVLRTLQGQVPVRDIQSYLPGRYYWCAAWLALLGPGVLVLRWSVAAFALGGLVLGLAAARRALPAAALPVLSLVLVLWLWPPHKLFEPALALSAAWIALRLIERPDVLRHAQAGLALGLVAFFERNHALYWTLALGACVPLAHWKRPAPGFAKRVVALGGGLILGLVPLASFVLFVPGFGAALLEETLFFLRTELNLNLPYPWPWRVDWAGIPSEALPGQIALHLAFLVPVLAPALAIPAALLARGESFTRRAPACVFGIVSLAYFHHVAGRSDPQHLAQVLHPGWAALFALPAAFGWRPLGAWCLWLSLLPVALVGARDSNPCLIEFRPLPMPLELREREIAGETLRLTPWNSIFVDRLQAVVATHVPAGEPLFAAPFFVTIYPLLGRISPVRETYFLRQLPRADQERILRQLETKRVRYAWITLSTIDQREDLHFSRTAPLVWAWLQREFEPVPDRRMPGDHVLLRKRGTPAAK